ncbi:MAG: hypothetical protein JNK33_03755, partial [Candidatus Doudnabacteria bacterium]|nr:hypothetical protein [Candidatus Doudnabacteria bacterium]
MTKHPKIIVVIGPTGSGKSEFAVKLAKKMNGEIISADSRQVYKGLDIGTGKVQGQWKKMRSQKVKVKTATSNSKNSKLAKQNSVYVYKGIPHYCIDYVSPKKQYTVTNFKHDAELAIEDIVRRGNTPIICGGTGQYVDALLLDQSIPEVPPNPRLRAQLEKKTTAQLFSMLQKKDPARAKTIDPYNPRRLIRALEIITATGKPVPRPAKKGNPFAAKGLPFVPKIH